MRLLGGLVLIATLALCGCRSWGECQYYATGEYNPSFCLDDAQDGLSCDDLPEERVKGHPYLGTFNVGGAGKYKNGTEIYGWIGIQKKHVGEAGVRVEVPIN